MISQRESTRRDVLALDSPALGAIPYFRQGLGTRRRPDAASDYFQYLGGPN